MNIFLKLAWRIEDVRAGFNMGRVNRRCHRDRTKNRKYAGRFTTKSVGERAEYYLAGFNFKCVLDVLNKLNAPIKVLNPPIIIGDTFLDTATTHKYRSPDELKEVATNLLKKIMESQDGVMAMAEGGFVTYKILNHTTWWGKKSYSYFIDFVVHSTMSGCTFKINKDDSIRTFNKGGKK